MVVWWAAALICLLAWWWAQGQRTAQAGVALVLALIGAAALVQLWRVLARGELQWDGLEWSLQTADGAVLLHSPQVRFDGQSRLLLRAMRPTGGGLWLWCERGSEDWRWDDLRRAVYSRAAHRP